MNGDGIQNELGRGDIFDGIVQSQQDSPHIADITRASKKFDCSGMQTADFGS